MRRSTLLVALALAGCLRGTPSERPPIHLNPNMDRQPKLLPQAESGFFYDGAAMQRPVEGTVARGDLREAPELLSGRSAWGYFVENPIAGSPGLLERGEERFRIYCVPCHGEKGDGRGMLFERAGVESADLLGDPVRRMQDGKIFDVITNGSGLMAGYRHPITPRDRWAIVAWIRELQSR